MLEIYVSNTQIDNLTKDLKLSAREILNLAIRTFKDSAKDFAKKVRQRANRELGISTKKLNQRIRQYVITDLKIKIFSGFYRTGITNWSARKTAKGVSYGVSGARKMRRSAFIANMPEGGRIAVKRTGEFHVPTKGRYAGKTYKRNTKRHKEGDPYQVEYLQKQVSENNEIDELITPILEDETIKFYEIFKKAFDRQVDKYLGKN